MVSLYSSPVETGAIVRRVLLYSCTTHTVRAVRLYGGLPFFVLTKTDGCVILRLQTVVVLIMLSQTTAGVNSNHRTFFWRVISWTLHID